GVAYAAQLEGVQAAIIMPKDAPSIKIENTRSYGAEVILYDRYTENREEIGAKIQQERGSYLIKPYDAPLTIYGQATMGIEIAQDLKEKGLKADALISNCGGGGLMAGLCIAMKHLSPETKLYSAEPHDFDDTARSLKSGDWESIDPESRSICDAILTPTPGQITFPILKKNLTEGFSISDEEALKAMAIAFKDLKTVVEPGGAASLAAAIQNKDRFKGKTVVVVLSGGNVDFDMYQQALQAA
ncbi:MAG: pyridoxal-phosphate dependent enzyme, partial [Alphaproteobacteria bacterium]|nr:pyridoxal-phosphate dependent enzyme [Alphaproteobacteria bacterium]